jgi:hypothetical protein
MSEAISGKLLGIPSIMAVSCGPCVSPAVKYLTECFPFRSSPETALLLQSPVKKSGYTPNRRSDRSVHTEFAYGSGTPNRPFDRSCFRILLMIS